MAQKKIWLSLAHMSGNEEAFIKEAFDTNWVVPLGPNVNGFEEDLKAYLTAPHSLEVVALSAGTAALHLALVMEEVGPGDEVICQSFTFSATANPIKYQGANPVFVGSEKDTWNMDPVALREAIEDRIQKTGQKPKAIMPVHLYGMPAKMEEIMAISKEYEIPVVEDAAEAMGSEYNGQKCGTFGDYGVLSFNGNKMITTSGGGALICPSEEKAKRVMFYATQARDNAPHYQHSKIGYNYRLSNICAGIGRGQMTVVNEHIAARRRNCAQYVSELSDLDGVTVKQNPSPSFDSNFWLSCVVIDPRKAGFTREDLRLKLEAEEIESRPLWKPMHLQPVFEGYPYYGDRTEEKLFDDGLCLPSGPLVTPDDITRITSIIRSLHK